MGQLSVIDQVTYEKGTSLLLDINAAIKQAEVILDPPTKIAWQAWQDTLTHKKQFTVPLENAKKLVTSKLSIYATTMEARRKEAEQKALAEAKLLESQEIDRLQKEGEAAAEAGDMVGAEEKFMEAATTFVAPAVSHVAMGKVGGTALISDYVIGVKDLKVFLSAIIAGTVRLDLNELITVKPHIIKAYVKATKHLDIPGLDIKEIKTVRGTGQ